MPTRIRILDPDYPNPAGGVRQLYRMADLLNAMGHAATVMHQNPEFRITWFKHSTPIEFASQPNLATPDYVVIPEEWAFELGEQVRGLRKVIYNQNAYSTFASLRTDGSSKYCPYFDPQVFATIAISDDSANYLRHAFPKARILRHVYDANPDNSLKYIAGAQKRKRFAFMPRKNPKDVQQVLQILRACGVSVGWEMQQIEGMSAQQTADALMQTAVFLSFGHPEGCPLPPAEAMLCGCVVVGYHGNGGREYFTAERGFPIDVGQIIPFVTAAENVMRAFAENPSAFDAMTRRAHDHIRTTYNAQTELESMRRISEEIFQYGGR